MTKSVLLSLLGLGVLGITSTAFAECERMYAYSYWGSPYVNKAIQMHVPAAGSAWGTISYSADTSSITEFCGADSDYFCFVPWFAVSKRFDGSVRKWTLWDRTFEVVRENQTIQILGRRLEGVFVIMTPPYHKDGEPWEYLFSPRYGLIGMTSREGTAWLAEESGFGASEPGPAVYPSLHHNPALFRGQNNCPTSNPSAQRESPPAESMDRRKD